MADQHPYLKSYVSGNIKYDFTEYTSPTDDVNNYMSGFTNINKNYRYAQYEGRDLYNTLISKEHLEMMSREITKKLAGVHPEGKNIIIPLDTIYTVVDSLFETTRRGSLEVLTEMGINYIVNHVRTEYDTIQKNNSYSLWITKYDVESGLQRVNGIKLNNKQRKAYYAWKY